MGAEILPALLLFIGFGFAICPALAHDAEQPISYRRKK